jgi:hypothetical protein
MHLDYCTIATMQANVCPAHLQYWEQEELLEWIHWLQVSECVRVDNSFKYFLKPHEYTLDNFKIYLCSKLTSLH